MNATPQQNEAAPALGVAHGSASGNPLAFRRVLRINRMLADCGHADVPSALNELNRLRDALRRIKEQTKDFERYSLHGVLHRIASDALKPNK
jgi:hypothetical protein